MFDLGRQTVGDIHARCTIRKRKRDVSYDPSLAEIRCWLRKYDQGDKVVGHNAVHDAFDSGAEVGSWSRCRLGLTAGSAYRR